MSEKGAYAHVGLPGLRELVNGDDANQPEKSKRVEINTYPEANERIVKLLRLGDDPFHAYVAQRIEELEKVVQEQDKRLKEAGAVLAWTKQNFDSEWTYELGTGEVVEEIIQKLERALTGKPVTIGDLTADENAKE